MLKDLERSGRGATIEEQRVLARWSGWGAIPQIFDDSYERWAPQRAALRGLLGSDEAWRAAQRTTLNAHYTPAAVVSAMWSTAQALGVGDGARVLEPGCGSGNFIGLAPSGLSMVGVELDSTTASVARHLYGGSAEIVASPFERFSDAEGFDLVIGNVPFASVSPHDPVHNRGRHALHNYFLVKSVAMTRPGGLVVALTSRYTLDAHTSAARRDLAAMADLVGAVRFPTGAFSASANTDAVVDLVVLRRRPDGVAPTDVSWLDTVERSLPGRNGAVWLRVNPLFVVEPDRVLGTLATGRGLYGDDELVVEPSGDLDSQLNAALERLVGDARELGLECDTSGAPAVEPIQTVEVPDGFDEGAFVMVDGGFARVSGGVGVPYEPRYAVDRKELAALIELRDEATTLLAAQLADPDDDLAEPLSRLNRLYDGYVAEYGPLNRFEWVRRGRVDQVTGEDLMLRRPARMGGFRDDPRWPLVASLEEFDDATQVAQKAPIMSGRVLSVGRRPQSVEAPSDAVAVCLDESGTVTVDRVGELLGVDGSEARRALGTLVFDEPGTGSLIPAAQYLSGNVRTKLATATEAAQTDPRFAVNVDALRDALPEQLGPEQITARLGMPWIPTRAVERFCVEEMDATVDLEYFAELGSWTVRLAEGTRRSVALSSRWGTERADGIVLLDATLNQRLHTVYDPADHGRRVRNDAETIAARDKQDQLSERFSQWVWEDPTRAEQLAARYNDLFCSTVLPAHDGSHLSLPGMASSFELRPHQRDAIARLLVDGRGLLAHAVGAGKTATMVTAAMEMRRLGVASKPAFVVPNHMLEQFSREWLQLYPTARLLVADAKRLFKARRQEFVARATTGEWDGIVFTQSGFAKVRLGADLHREYSAQQADAIRRALIESRAGRGLSVKRLERRVAQADAQVQRAIDERGKDDGIRFEEIGIDYLFVDEAHAYKNRRIITSIDGMSSTGSNRSQDLDSKLWYLRQRHGHRVVTFATATPVANSVSELWGMQTYLQPDVLAETGLAPFDAWAANFGRTHTALELAPDGASYRMQTRFARFQNVPELLGLYHQVADVRTADQIDLPVPTVAGGAPETVVVPPSEALVDYVAGLADRAERIRSRGVDPAEDNMLKVTGDGRRAALDLRLVDEFHLEFDNGKLATAADRIARIHHDTRHDRFTDTLGRPMPRPGALQLVFCDVSTPASAEWNAYDELRSLLVERGVAAESIRFMQSAGNDTAKEALFAACRSGEVAVIVGSTETMGVGTNIQDRAVALHHLDAPWRPADIEQREGRVIRQGNQNPHVQIVRYVTEGSFDTYMWQTLERKAAFIAQVTAGEVVDRDVDDIGDQALSFAEVKALATGDPLIMEKATVDAEVARLTRLERAHHADQARLQRTLDAATQRAERSHLRAERLRETCERMTDTRGDLFVMTIEGQTHNARVDAGQHLQATLQGVASTHPVSVGVLGGLEVTAQRVDDSNGPVRVSIDDADVTLEVAPGELATAEPARWVTRLERGLQRLPDRMAALEHKEATASAEARQAASRLGAVFSAGDELRGLRHRQAELTHALAADPDEGDASTSRPDHVPPAKISEGLDL